MLSIYIESGGESMLEIKALLSYMHLHLRAKDKQAVRDYIKWKSVSDEAIADLMFTNFKLSQERVNIWWKTYSNLLSSERVEIITCVDTIYPFQLKNIEDFPLVLFAKGNVSLLQSEYIIAIVGTRRPTLDGLTMCYDAVKYLSKKPFTVISGLAFGIDAKAHQSALRTNSPTIAVLPCGLDTIAPSSHTKLAQEIIENSGLIISEAGLGTKPLRAYYIQRNRIMSGMSHKTFIVEAGLKSGSLATAHHALEQGRELYVMPGARSNPVSAGTNYLMRLGAIPIVDPEDLEPDLALLSHSELSTFDLTPDEQRLLRYIKQSKIGDIHQLASALNLSISSLNVMLMKLHSRYYIDFEHNKVMIR